MARDTDDINGPGPDPAIWTCTIGEIPRARLGLQYDAPLRDAVEKAYREAFGEDAKFTFSGWGHQLEERERAVVEDRLPDPLEQLREIAVNRRVILEYMGLDLDMADKLVEKQAQLTTANDDEKRGLLIQDWVAAAVIKLGQAAVLAGDVECGTCNHCRAAMMAAADDFLEVGALMLEAHHALTRRAEQ